MKEASTGVVTLEAATNVVEGDEPSLVSMMIAFMYENDYDPRLEQNTLLADERHDDGEPGIGIEAPLSESASKEMVASTNDEDDWVAGMSTKAKKQKRKKKSTAPLMMDFSTELDTPAPPAAFANSFLPVHAKIFALGSKYHIPHLQDRALAKFKADACRWSKKELIESIAIAFNTSPDNDSLRDAIKAIITENSAQLTDDSAFEDAVNNIQGLAFELFKLQTYRNSGQRTCVSCNSVYQSRCAVEGCVKVSFGYSGHRCDKGSLCMNCHD